MPRINAKADMYDGGSRKELVKKLNARRQRLEFVGKLILETFAGSGHFVTAGQLCGLVTAHGATSFTVREVRAAARRLALLGEISSEVSEGEVRYSAAAKDARPPRSELEPGDVLHHVCEVGPPDRDLWTWEVRGEEIERVQRDRITFRRAVHGARMHHRSTIGKLYHRTPDAAVRAFFAEQEEAIAEARRAISEAERAMSWVLDSGARATPDDRAVADPGSPDPSPPDLG